MVVVAASHELLQPRPLMEPNESYRGFQGGGRGGQRHVQKCARRGKAASANSRTWRNTELTHGCTLAV